MSQPESNPSTDGASALLAAADKSDDGPRRKRYVPKAKASASASAPAPQPPAEKAEPVQASGNTSEAVPVAQEPSQAGVQVPVAPTTHEVPAPPAADAPPATNVPAADTPPPAANTPPPAADTAPAGGSPTSTTDVAFPASPLRFESVFTRPTHSMDPEMFAMFSQRQVRILKSLANIVNMFLERKEEYDNAVQVAVAAGFPKDELAKLAVQFDCVPFLEAVLGEQRTQ